MRRNSRLNKNGHPQLIHTEIQSNLDLKISLGKRAIPYSNINCKGSNYRDEDGSADRQIGLTLESSRITPESFFIRLKSKQNLSAISGEFFSKNREHPVEIVVYLLHQIKPYSKYSVDNGIRHGSRNKVIDWGSCRYYGAPSRNLRRNLGSTDSTPKARTRELDFPIFPITWLATYGRCL